MNRVDEKFVFEGRNAKVREQVLKRLRPRDEREGTWTGPEDDGREPFLDAFENNPNDPYIINLARGIVDSWMVSDPRLPPSQETHPRAFPQGDPHRM